MAADRKQIVRDDYAAFAAGDRSFFERPSAMTSCSPLRPTTSSIVPATLRAAGPGRCRRWPTSAARAAGRSSRSWDRAVAAARSGRAAASGAPAAGDVVGRAGRGDPSPHRRGCAIGFCSRCWRGLARRTPASRPSSRSPTASSAGRATPDPRSRCDPPRASRADLRGSARGASGFRMSSSCPTSNRAILTAFQLCCSTPGWTHGGTSTN